MSNGNRTRYTRGFNKGRTSKFRVGSRVRRTPEEGQRTYWPKRCGNNNQDESNSPKALNDKNHQASFQTFRQLTNLIFFRTYLKHILRITNVKPFFSDIEVAAAAELILTKPRDKCRMGVTYTWEEWDDMKITSLLNNINQTNTNVQKLKKAQRKLTCI